MKSTKSGKIKYFLKKKNNRKGDQKTNSSTLRAFGIFQFMLSLMSFYSLEVVQPIFENLTQQSLIIGFRSIFIILAYAFIFVSMLFAFYLRLHNFILFGVLGIVSDLIENNAPIFFYPVSYNPLFSLSTVFIMILFGPIIFLSILLTVVINNKEEARIRKEILVLGTKYPDFKVKNISKNCSSDKNTIIKIAKKMIKNKEIYADYFKLSKKFVFNNKANTEEIDKLMEMFSEWETEHIGKKI